MCSQYLCKAENMAIIPHQYTNLNLYIACNCIAKTGIINSYEFKKKAEMNDRYAKIIYEREQQRQQLKEQEKIQEQQRKEQEQKIKDYDPCMDCGKLEIHKSKSHWCFRCTPCFKIFQQGGEEKEKKTVLPEGVCFLKMKKEIY